MHGHLFGEKDSMHSSVHEVFDAIENKFQNVDSISKWLNENLENTLETTEKVIESSSKNMDERVINMYEAIQTMNDHYSQSISFTSDPISNPFDPSQTEIIVFPCDYCEQIPGKLSKINDSFSSGTN